MDRRSFLTGALGVAVAGPALAAVEADGPMLPGTLNPAQLGIDPDSATDQSRGLQQLLNLASNDNR